MVTGCREIGLNHKGCCANFFTDGGQVLDVLIERTGLFRFMLLRSPSSIHRDMDEYRLLDEEFFMDLAGHSGDGLKSCADIDKNVYCLKLIGGGAYLGEITIKKQ